MKKLFSIGIYENIKHFHENKVTINLKKWFFAHFFKISTFRGRRTLLRHHAEKIDFCPYLRRYQNSRKIKFFENKFFVHTYVRKITLF